jgi:hypothetical protein
MGQLYSQSIPRLSRVGTFRARRPDPSRLTDHFQPAGQMSAGAATGVPDLGVWGGACRVAACRLLVYGRDQCITVKHIVCRSSVLCAAAGRGGHAVPLGWVNPSRRRASLQDTVARPVITVGRSTLTGDAECCEAICVIPDVCCGSAVDGLLGQIAVGIVGESACNKSVPAKQTDAVRAQRVIMIRGCPTLIRQLYARSAGLHPVIHLSPEQWASSKLQKPRRGLVGASATENVTPKRIRADGRRLRSVCPRPKIDLLRRTAMPCPVDSHEHVRTLLQAYNAPDQC